MVKLTLKDSLYGGVTRQLYVAFSQPLYNYSKPRQDNQHSEQIDEGKQGERQYTGQQGFGSALI